MTTLPVFGYLKYQDAPLYAQIIMDEAGLGELPIVGCANGTYVLQVNAHRMFTGSDVPHVFIGYNLSEDDVFTAEDFMAGRISQESASRTMIVI